ncbi:MAG TPA: hypothetical protein IGS53_17565 [Leptolyngbyaceae cyanobacterium M33_DOE_097]|nr:hypothetical protein [Leptolyngbyaceae cyanobacterium M33_DOE_097]
MINNNRSDHARVMRESQREFSQRQVQEILDVADFEQVIAKGHFDVVVPTIDLLEGMV